jgi:hypothetical protein
MVDRAAARRRAVGSAFRTGTRLRRLLGNGLSRIAMRIADLLPVLSVGARRLAGGAPWRDATTLLPPTSLYCTQFRNSFLTRCPTSESQGPYVGKLKAQSSSIQLGGTRLA